jgi:hypothetical protein
MFAQNAPQDVWPLRHALIGVYHKAAKARGSRKDRTGERPKRLRTLVEALADWWLSYGGTIAPTVDAKRLYKNTAFVCGRRGRFLEFAIALFDDIDDFRRSEIESAVINVYQARLSRNLIARRRAPSRTRRQRARAGKAKGDAGRSPRHK